MSSFLGNFATLIGMNKKENKTKKAAFYLKANKFRKMCDYNVYSIVAPEHCVFVPKLPTVTKEQLDLLFQKCETLLGFRTRETSWEFARHFTTDNNYGRYMCEMSIKNIDGLVNKSKVKEPVAEIVIWCWKDNKQEIVKKVLLNSNEDKHKIYPYQLNDATLVIIRLIEKRKLVNALCPPSEFLSSDAFTISVEDQNFVVSAHRLMQISPVFRAMLTVEMREKAERKVEVKDAEPEHFRAFLEVIDPDRTVYPNPTNVVGVLKLADRYQVKLAKDRCEWHLMNCVELPLFKRLQLADTYRLDKLKTSILSIGSEKLRILYKTNAYRFRKGQISMALLNDLTSRICYNE